MMKLEVADGNEAEVHSAVQCEAPRLVREQWMLKREFSERLYNPKRRYSTMNNLFADLPTDLPNELVTILAENQHIRIERIVSSGHSSAENFWYEQREHEWVVVLKGEAKLYFAGDNEPVHLTPGDHVHIPAHRRHRVAWTTPDAPTVWLAVFYSDA